MIITLTLNPAIDKSTSIDQLVPEYKLRCDMPQLDAGGGGINISRAIKRLGGQSLAVFTSGGPNGLQLQELVQEQGINYQIVGVQDNSRENILVLERNTQKRYRFGMPGPRLTNGDMDAVLATLRTLPVQVDYVVASGSLPPGVSPDFYAVIAQELKERNIRFVLDAAGEPLKRAAEEGVFMLNPNLRELATLVGSDKDRLDVAEALPAAQTILKRGACEVLVVSMGKDGALLLTAEGHEQIKAPTVEKHSIAGMGDSMLGGMVWALSEGKSYGEVIRMGVACGSAATLHAGTELFQKEDVQRLLGELN